MSDIYNIKMNREIAKDTLDEIIALTHEDKIFNKMRYRKALEFAVKCIELNEKKKPIRKANGDIWHCPQCKNEIYWDTDYGQQHFDFCNWCGQALDWKYIRGKK